MKVLKGDIIYLTENFPKQDRIQGGVRPYVVVSNDIGNEHSQLMIVVPLTHSKKRMDIKTHCLLEEGSVALCEQIQTVPQKWIECRTFHISKKNLKQLDEALKVSLGVR